MRRVDLGHFTRPASETGTASARVEPVLAYLVTGPGGAGLFDTGMGIADAGTEAHYRPVRRRLPAALADHGVDPGDLAWVANCHLHFDHCGANPALSGRPIFVQATELATAREVEGFTLPELVDGSISYEPLDGAAEIAPGVHLLPTPGHVAGHQSLVVRLGDGTTVVCAGQSHDTASQFGADALAPRGQGTPVPPAWVGELLRLDPARVVFAHDMAVWEPR